MIIHIRTTHGQRGGDPGVAWCGEALDVRSDIQDPINGYWSHTKPLPTENWSWLYNESDCQACADVYDVTPRVADVEDTAAYVPMAWEEASTEGPYEIVWYVSTIAGLLYGVLIGDEGWKRLEVVKVDPGDMSTWLLHTADDDTWNPFDNEDADA